MRSESCREREWNQGPADRPCGSRRPLSGVRGPVRLLCGRRGSRPGAQHLRAGPATAFLPNPVLPRSEPPACVRSRRRLPVALYPSPPLPRPPTPVVSSLLGRFPPTAPAPGPLPVPRRRPQDAGGRRRRTWAVCCCGVGGVRAARAAAVWTPPRAWQVLFPSRVFVKLV